MDPTDVGIKMSQPGYDVNTVPDANVYFSSSWPWLKIGLTAEVVMAGSTLVISHPYKYPPFSMVWTSSVGFDPSRLSITDTAVTISGTAGEVIRYYIFLLPLNVAYESGNVLTTPDPQLFVDHDTGIKFAKFGRSIDSEDLRDYTIHSGTRSPLLHKVVYQKLANITGGDYNGIFGMEWKNDLPYWPTFFAFYTPNGQTWRILNASAQNPPKINFDGLDAHNIVGAVINAANTTTGYGSIIVLKDPYDAPNVVRVTI